MKNPIRFPIFVPLISLLFGLPVFIIVTGATLVCWLVYKLQGQKQPAKPSILYLPVQTAPLPQKTEQDLLLEAYSLMQMRIGNYLRALYPQSQWHWQTPNALKSISEGKETLINLKNAGGYQYARVIYHDLQFQSLQFVTYGLPENAKPVPLDKPEPVSVEKPETDFSLLAFDWINSRLEYLNALANEAIAQNSNCFEITAEELPEQDCWQDICTALQDEFHDADFADNKIIVTIEGKKGK